MRIELRTEAAADTRAVGQALAELLEARDTVVLTGELGAGKTTLVQGVARGLEIEDPIVSPTFTLVREYRGRLNLSHVDVYRLDRIQDVVDLGLDELGDGDSVMFVEWGDAVEDVLPDDRLRVELTTEGPDQEARRMVLTPEGGTWRGRWPRLEQTLGPWRALA